MSKTFRFILQITLQLNINESDVYFQSLTVMLSSSGKVRGV